MIRLDLTFSVNEFGKGMGRLNRLMFQIFDYDHQETDPSSQQNDDDEDNEPEPPDFWVGKLRHIGKKLIPTYLLLWY